MADWEYYKIADGPLDIVGKTLKVVTSLSDTPIITSDWVNNEIGMSSLGVRKEVPYIREKVIVLNNYNNSGNYFATNGTPPLTGIFVSENIRSISIAESEEVHKIDAKYTESIPSIILEYSDNGDAFVQKNGGFISLVMGADPLSVTLKLSTGEPCSFISVIPITSTALDAESHASIELVDESTGECIITPPVYDGSNTRIIDTYLLTYVSREQVDGKYVEAAFYIVIGSERMI